MSLNLSKWTVLLLIEVSLATGGVLAVTLVDPLPACTNSPSQSYLQIISVSLGVNYGNSTTNSWHHLQLSECTTLFTAMQTAGWRLQTKDYGSLGVFILGINGVYQSTTAGTYWQWYYWIGGHWLLGPVGASEHVTTNGEIVLWYLAAPNAGPPPPP